MEKFEFKSQICTTREQSERLLKLGLKKETGDCALHFDCVDIDGEVHYMAYEIGHKCCGIPAWSLHRLIEMSLNLSYGVAYCYTAGSNMNVTYDEVIDMIEWAISKECFNKDYLEESQCEK